MSLILRAQVLSCIKFVATVPPIVKTVHLLSTKSCARFGLNFSIILLCQVKIPDEKNSMHVYLMGKNINKPLVHSD